MKHFQRRSWIVLLALLAYAGAGTLLEFAHHDDILPSGTIVPALVNHACGETEHHIPLDQWRPCAVCAAAHQRVSLAALSGIHAGSITVVTRLICPAPDLLPHIPPHSHPQKRGPPAV